MRTSSINRVDFLQENHVVAQMTKKEELLSIEGSADLRSMKWENSSSAHLMLHKRCMNGFPALEGVWDFLITYIPFLIMSY